MRFHQLIRFALGGLWRQKVRTGLTLIGVIIGSCALAFSTALGIGLRAFIDTEFHGRDEFWRIRIHVGEPTPGPNGIPPEKVAVHGQMSDDRRARIRDALTKKYLEETDSKPPVQLTPEALASIRQLPEVREVRTVRASPGRIWIGERFASGLVAAGNLEPLADRLIAGRLPASEDAAEVVVSEFLLYQLGIRDDSQLEAILGQAIPVDVGGVKNAQPMALARALTGRFLGDDLSRTQLEALDKLTRQLPAMLDKFDLTSADRAALRMLREKKPDTPGRRVDSGHYVSGEFRIVGVVRVLTREDRKKSDPLTPYEYRTGEIYLPSGSGERLFQTLPWLKGQGFFAAEVWVTPGGDLASVVDAVEAMGYQTQSGLKWFKSAKVEVTLIAAGLNLFALVALFVAGIGITNTLVTSVVERTREIGILKAIGATRGQVLGIFLTEGAAIGLFGSMLGLALARLLAFPADAWVHRMIEKQLMVDKMLTTTIFIFPTWLWGAAMAFALSVTTVAAYYPARRAAGVDPILALKYE